MVLVIGITGASGAIYGIRTLEILSKMDQIETHLVISKSGEQIIRLETNYEVNVVRDMADYNYNIQDVGARIASGSFRSDGMLVAPCSIRTMSALANSFADNLLTRAGDVTLKERKTLVLMVRETPLHSGHLQSMFKLSQMGAVVLPPVPSFYQKPTTVEEIVDHTVGRALDQFGISHSISRRWSGIDNQ